MAVDQKALAIGTINSVSQTAIFTNIDDVRIQPLLVLTNASSSIINVSIYINSGSGIFLFDKKPLPAGVGLSTFCDKLANLRLNQGFTILLQADSANLFNYFLSGVQFDFT